MVTRLLLLLCCSIALTGAYGQDTVFLKNGSMYVGRINRMRRFGVDYYVLQKRGPDRLVNFSDVARVAYSTTPYAVHVRKVKVFVRRSDKALLTMNAPNYCYVGTYPGVSVGLEYQRFVDSSGKFSFGIGAHYFWAGTAAFGKVYRETRANLRGAFFEFELGYHPVGNTHRIDPGIGVSIPVGTMSRRDVTDVGTIYPLTTDDGSHLFVALLLQGELCIHNYRHFVYTIYGSCGPMLPAGATAGLSGQIGFKIGGRF